MFFEALQSYYAPVTTLLIFTVLIVTDKLFSKRFKRLFILEICVIFLIIAATWSDRCLSAVSLNGMAWKVRTATTFINFAFSPLSPMILVLIYRTEGDWRMHKLFFGPELCNIIFCILSIWAGLIFHISSENLYNRGPLFFFPFAVSAFYLLSLIFYSAKQQNKPNRLAETILLSGIMGAIGLASFLEVYFVIRFMIWSTTEICVILYFLLLTIQYIMYDPLTGAFSRVAYTKQLEKIDGRTACTIAMIDLNNLKQFNDGFGHSAGDDAICGVVSAVLKAIPRHMRLYRYGGDEFVLFSNTLCRGEMEDILLEAQNYCGTVEKTPLSFAFGVAEYHPGDDLHNTVLSADANMYRCKQQMRGSV